MFSGFYLALFLLLLALIVRGVAFEFRSKDSNPRWRSLWDWAIFAGSLIPAILLGVAFGNLVRGVPIDASMNYVGGFFFLLNPYALLADASTLVLFTLYGAIFLSLKTTADLQRKAHVAAGRLWFLAVILLLALLIATYLATDLYARLGVNPGVVPIVGMAAILLSGFSVEIATSDFTFNS